MKSRDAPRFDIETLRERAGEKVFARGEEYHADGEVQILAIEPARVLAQVAGTEDYRTVLTGRGADIGGNCSCPAFVDWGFCKHMVATALAVNAAGSGAEAEGAGALSRIRDHLKQNSVDVLVGIIVDVAERDPALFRKLELLAAAAGKTDDKTLEARLRKAIDGATRTGGYVDYSEAADWAAGVDETLDAIAGLASGARAGLVVKLMERAIDRIEQAIESIDDSDGHCSELLHRALDIHLAAAGAARLEPVQLARDLFAREMEDDYETFYGAAALYADVLGETGLAEYRRLARAAWERLVPRPARPRGGRELDESFDGRYDRLKHTLDFFAERDGDLETRIALRSRDLSSAWSYLELAKFCLAHGREEEALLRAEEGLWKFEDGRPDQRLVLFTVELLSKAGRKDDAEAHLWRAFAKAPSLELYGQVRNTGGEAAREQAIKSLDVRLANQMDARWHDAADILIRILMKEKMFAAAWVAATKYKVPAVVKAALAQASEATHPREALEVYSAQVEQLAASGRYPEAARIIKRMAALRKPAEQTAFVLALKLRHGRKRNFMKLLG